MSEYLKTIKNFINSKPKKQKYLLYGAIGYTTYFIGTTLLAYIWEKSYKYNSFTKANSLINEYDNKWKDKTVIITGVTSGIGYETGKLLINAGCKVILLSRKLGENGNDQQLLDKMNIKNRDNITCMSLDLESFESIEKCATDIANEFSQIDFLINNAGVMAIPKYTEIKQTIAGDDKETFIEKQFGVNHLGHYYLVKLLKPTLSSSNARVINVSSGAHQFAFNNKTKKLLETCLGDNDNTLPSYMGLQKNNYNKWTNYGISKACNIVFAHHCNYLEKGNGFLSFAINPGTVQTNLQRNLLFGIPPIFMYIPIILLLPAFAVLEIKSVQRGVANIIRAMTMENNSIYCYVDNCKVAAPNGLSFAKYEDYINPSDTNGELLFHLSDGLLKRGGAKMELEWSKH